MPTENTSVHEDDAAKNGEKDANISDKEKRASNASFARKRIAEREARKAMTPVQEETSDLDPEEEEMIANSLVGKRTKSMEERIGAMEERVDADEVAREVAKFVKHHEYSEYLDENAMTAKALDPKYAELELDEIAWLALKEKMPEIYGKQQKQATQRIAETALPSSAGHQESIKDMSLDDYIKNRDKILNQFRK